jgi:hypothetical protein
MFIITIIETNRLNIPKGLPLPPTTISMIGAIELSNKENILALARFWGY